MARRLTYADALVLLGGSSPAVAAFDRVLGGVLTVGKVAGVGFAGTLADARGEFVRVGNSVVAGLHDRVLGLGRFDRTQRLRAAHAVIVVTAYFEAVEVAALPFDLSEVILSRTDQTSLAGADPDASGVGSWIADLVTADIPVPSPDCSYESILDELRRWYADLSQRFISYLGGLAVWDQLDESAQARAIRALRDDLPARAVDDYEIMHRALAVEVPEFGLWVQRQDYRATGSELRRTRQGLLDLEALLRETVSGRPQRQRAALAAAYRAGLDEPIVGRVGTPPQLQVPALGQIYIDPHFRVRSAVPGDRPSDEGWWERITSRDDLSDFLAGFLTAPRATEAPLVILGHPGAGKSALTKVLAARLPATDFLPVRVPLREVPADAELQDQIEYALHAATGDRITWPELYRTAGGAQPVVLLDGFDELLQATGVSQSDFLEKVSAFQHREAVQQRPVAMIVTSRTAVADRARMPEGTLILRLDPFTPEQVARWLDIWNQTNAALWTANGLQPLPANLVHRYGELASQPLLLLMLALYDAQANELQTLAATLPDPPERRANNGSLDAAGLYERLLTSYAEREIRKSHDGVPEPAVEAILESELMRLSLAAFAMFNRSRQWVTEAELDADLAALSIRAPNPPGVGGFRAPLTPGQELVGRFFFIQRAQAVRDDQ